MIELRTQLAPDLPDIRGADNEIRDALTNLIFMLWTPTSAGGVIQVCTDVLTSAGGSGTPEQHVRLEVRDTGIGMDEETRRRCLEPFFTTKAIAARGSASQWCMGWRNGTAPRSRSTASRGDGTTMRLLFPGQS